eukprot:g17687.t1
MSTDGVRASEGQSRKIPEDDYVDEKMDLHDVGKAAILDKAINKHPRLLKAITLLKNKGRTVLEPTFAEAVPLLAKLSRECKQYAKKCTDENRSALPILDWAKVRAPRLFDGYDLTRHSTMCILALHRFEWDADFFLQEDDATMEDDAATQYLDACPGKSAPDLAPTIYRSGILRRGSLSWFAVADFVPNAEQIEFLNWWKSNLSTIEHGGNSMLYTDIAHAACIRLHYGEKCKLTPEERGLVMLMAKAQTAAAFKSEEPDEEMTRADLEKALEESHKRITMNVAGLFQDISGHRGATKSVNAANAEKKDTDKLEAFKATPKEWDLKEPEGWEIEPVLTKEEYTAKKFITTDVEKMAQVHYFLENRSTPGMTLNAPQKGKHTELAANMRVVSTECGQTLGDFVLVKPFALCSDWKAKLRKWVGSYGFTLPLDTEGNPQEEMSRKSRKDKDDKEDREKVKDKKGEKAAADKKRQKKNDGSKAAAKSMKSMKATSKSMKSKAAPTPKKMKMKAAAPAKGKKRAAVVESSSESSDDDDESGSDEDDHADKPGPGSAEDEATDEDAASPEPKKNDEKKGDDTKDAEKPAEEKKDGDDVKKSAEPVTITDKKELLTAAKKWLESDKENGPKWCAVRALDQVTEIEAFSYSYFISMLMLIFNKRRLTVRPDEKYYCTFPENGKPFPADKLLAFPKVHNWEGTHMRDDSKWALDIIQHSNYLGEAPSERARLLETNAIWEKRSINISGKSLQYWAPFMEKKEAAVQKKGKSLGLCG